MRLLLVLTLVAVRLAALGADPPSWLSWSTGVYTDEGFYTLDARHEALFGTWAPGNFHDRLLSPLLSLLQQAVFTIFGVGHVQARLISVAFGLLTVLVFWWGLRWAYGTGTADVGALLFLGLAPPFVLYNRLALQETPTVFWLALAFAVWVRNGFLPAGAAAAVAVIVKPLAAFLLPAYLAPRSASPAGDGGRTGPRRDQGLTLLGLGIVLGLYAAFWYAPHQAELARMGTYYRVHQLQPHSPGSLWLNVRRGLVGGERGVLPSLLMLLPVPFLLAARGSGRLRRADPAAVLLTAWLLLGLAFCLLSSYTPSRYYVLFLPALAGLAARGMVGMRRPVQSGALVLFVLTSGFWYGRAWTERAYTMRDAGRRLAAALPAGSVVIGEFAPALCLDTQLAAVPVQPGLSNDDHPVERLRATHVAVRRAPVWEDWWHRRYPGVVRPSHRTATFVLGNRRRQYTVDIYEVK